MMYLRKCGDIFMQFFMLKKWQWYSGWLCQMGITSIDSKTGIHGTWNKKDKYRHLHIYGLVQHDKLHTDCGYNERRRVRGSLLTLDERRLLIMKA